MNTPLSYVALDTETNDLPNRHGEDRFGCVHLTSLGWVCVPKTGETTVGQVLLSLPDGVEMSPGAARVTGLSVEQLREEGLPPGLVLREFAEWLSECPRAKRLVGHNIIGFDLPVLDRQFLRYEIPSVDWEDTHEIWDTGALFLAHRVGMRQRKDENLFRFQKRVLDGRRKAQWNLDEACRQLWVESDRGLHGAGEDALLSSLVLERMRSSNFLRGVLYAS